MNVINKIVSLSHDCGAWILAGTASFITLDVVLRFIFNWPLPAVYEITQELLIVIFISLAMASAKHVSKGIIVSRLPPSALHKVKLLSLAINFVFVLLLFIGAAYMLFSSVKWSELSESQLGYPLWPARLSVMLGLGSLALVQVISFFKELTRTSS